MDDSNLTAEQSTAIDRLHNYDTTLLVAGTGVGKTVIALTAVAELIEGHHLRRVIVACPAKVLEQLVWPNEAAKWGHLRALTILQLEGTSQQRVKQLLSCPADIIVVSLNNLDWLLNQDHDADGIIIDELSKAAGKQTAGLKSKKKAGRLVWRVGMTATPVSQDFTKLFNMTRVLDGGAALGTNKSKFMDEYFTSDYMGYNWELRPGADALIMKRVAGLVHAIEDTKEETLPALKRHVIRFDMPAETRVIYNEMKKDMVAGDVEAANEAVKSGKLRQLSGGFIYRTEIVKRPGRDPVFKTVLDTRYDFARLAAAAVWVKATPRAAIIFYEFAEQREELLSLKNSTTDVGKFLAGLKQILVAQISSLSHGTDGLQHVCCDMLMYHPFWSRDETEQSCGRLWRTGQEKPVTVTTLICEDSLDDLVVARVTSRARWMDLFNKHLRG